MKENLLHILGHELFTELGVRDVTDKAELINTLQTNAGAYKASLEKAEREFKAKAKEAVARVRERYRENDENLKQALSVMKFSGLGDLGMQYLVSQIKGQMVHVDI